MRKKDCISLFLFVVLAMVLSFTYVACGVTPSDGGSTSPKTYNFYTDNCSEMGGTKTSKGACLIPCKADRDCENIVGASTCGFLENNYWEIHYCMPDNCTRQAGWHSSAYGSTCLATCNGESDYSTCSIGTVCSRNDATKIYYCGGYISRPSSSASSGGSGGGVCSGCGGLFCAGRCVGCPGC